MLFPTERKENGRIGTMTPSVHTSLLFLLLCTVCFCFGRAEFCRPRKYGAWQIYSNLHDRCCQSYHRMTHRHPGVPSAPSLSRPTALLFDASSSSTISWGFIDICTTFGVSALNRHSFRGVLSSNKPPKWINRILLGLLGFGSHSSRHSLKINSFNV